jgi:transcriptional regulator of arginine metabolism
VVSVDDNGTLVVIKTTPGTASAIALAIDTARMEQVLGTLAGDDTIFLAPARGHAAGKVTQKLKRLFKKG